MKDKRVKYIGDKVDENTAPDELSDLAQDATHRTVTDTEKSTWNNKAETSALNNKADQSFAIAMAVAL